MYRGRSGSRALDARPGSRIHPPRPGRRQWERAEWGRSGEPRVAGGRLGAAHIGEALFSIRHRTNVLSTVGEAAAFLEAFINERFRTPPGRYQAGPCRRQRQQRSVIASFRWFTSGVRRAGAGGPSRSRASSAGRRAMTSGNRAPRRNRTYNPLAGSRVISSALPSASALVSGNMASR